MFGPTIAWQQTEYPLGYFAREESAAWKVFTFLDDKYTMEQFTKLFTGEYCCKIPQRAYDLPGNTDLPPCPRDWPLDQPLDEAGYESENESEAAAGFVKKDPFGGVDVNQQADILTFFLPNAFALSVLYPRLGEAAAEDGPRALLQLGNFSGGIHNHSISADALDTYNPGMTCTQVYALAPTFLDLIDRASAGSVVWLRIYAISNEAVLSALTSAIGRGCKVKLIINAVVHAGTDGKPRSVNRRLNDFFLTHQSNPNLVAVEHRHSCGQHWNILHGKFLMTD